MVDPGRPASLLEDYKLDHDGHDTEDTAIYDILQLSPLGNDSNGYPFPPPLASPAEIEEIKSYFTCSIFSPWRPDKETLKLHFKAVMGIWGTVFLWLGCWKLWSQESLTYKAGDENLMGWALFPNTTRVNLAYLFIGAVLLIFTDSLYNNAGMDTKMNPREGLVPPSLRWWMRKLHKRKHRLWRPALRAFVAFWAMILVWIALYRLFDSCGTARPLRDCIYQAVGLGVLIASKSLYQVSLVFPPETEYRRQLRGVGSMSSACSCVGCLEFLVECVPHEALPFVKCWVSLVAQNLLWVGSYNTQLYFSSSNRSMHDLLVRSWVVIVAGWFGMVLTGSVWYNSYIDFDEPVPETLPKKRDGYMSILFYLRVLVALYAQFSFINGAWTLCDAFFYHNTWYRNVLVALLGLAMCCVAETLQTNACVVPPEFVVFEAPNDVGEVSASHDHDVLADHDKVDVEAGAAFLFVHVPGAGATDQLHILTDQQQDLVKQKIFTFEHHADPFSLDDLDDGPSATAGDIKSREQQFLAPEKALARRKLSSASSIVSSPSPFYVGSTTADV